MTLRGLCNGEAADSLLFSACWALWAFAGIGGIAGWIAGQTVEESVRTRVAAELAAQEKASAEAPAR